MSAAYHGSECTWPSTYITGETTPWRREFSFRITGRPRLRPRQSSARSSQRPTNRVSFSGASYRRCSPSCEVQRTGDHRHRRLRMARARTAGPGRASLRGTEANRADHRRGQAPLRGQRRRAAGAPRRKRAPALRHERRRGGRGSRTEDSRDGGAVSHSGVASRRRSAGARALTPVRRAASAPRPVFQSSATTAPRAQRRRRGRRQAAPRRRRAPRRSAR